MTKDKKLKLSELEARQNSACIDFKLQMIPASIRNIYSNIGEKEELVARELIVNNHVFIGITYANGSPVSAYTTDASGKQIPLEKLDNITNALTTPELISERLSEISKQLVAEEQKSTSQTKTPTKATKIAPTQKRFSHKEERRA